MNLNADVAGVIGAVNPRLQVSVRLNQGNITNSDGTRSPSYSDPISLLAQVQPITWRDIQMMDGLNLQGTRKAIYLSGQIDVLVRVTNQGGDLISFPDGSIWLVGIVLEGWATAGWCKVAATLQDGS